MSDQLSPEDLGLLVQLAQPIYAESKSIENKIIDNRVVNGGFDDGSVKIRRGLEEMQRQLQVPSFPHNPPPPPMPQQVAPVFIQPPLPERVEAPQAESPQLEFNFNSSEQKETNDLLKKISKQLTTLIGLLESEKKKDASKSKTNDSNK